METLPWSLPVNRALFLVIPDILYRESILVWFRMDPRYQLAGMTTGMVSAEPTTQCHLTLSVN